MGRTSEETNVSLNYPKIPHNYVPEYQQSSIPWVTSSYVATAGDIHKLSFPAVTRFVVIHNGDKTGNSELLIGFTSASIAGLTGSGNHFHLHSGETTIPWEIKCTDIYITADANNTKYSIIAGLTNIQRSAFPVLTASNGFEGVG